MRRGNLWAGKRALNAAHQRNGLKPLDRVAIVQIVEAWQHQYKKWELAVQEANAKQEELDKLRGTGGHR